MREACQHNLKSVFFSFPITSPTICQIPVKTKCLSGEDPGHARLSAGLGTPRDPPDPPPPEELREVSGKRKVWAPLLKLLRPRPSPRWSRRGWMNSLSTYELSCVKDVFAHNTTCISFWFKSVLAERQDKTRQEAFSAQESPMSHPAWMPPNSNLCWHF